MAFYWGGILDIDVSTKKLLHAITFLVRTDPLHLHLCQESSTHLELHAQ